MWFDTPLVDLSRTKFAASGEALRALLRGQTLTPQQSADVGWLLLLMALMVMVIG